MLFATWNFKIVVSKGTSIWSGALRWHEHTRHEYMDWCTALSRPHMAPVHGLAHCAGTSTQNTRTWTGALRWHEHTRLEYMDWRIALARAHRAN